MASCSKGNLSRSIGRAISLKVFLKWGSQRGEESRQETNSFRSRNIKAPRVIPKTNLVAQAQNSPNIIPNKRQKSFQRMPNWGFPITINPKAIPSLREQQVFLQLIVTSFRMLTSPLQIKFMIHPSTSLSKALDQDFPPKPKSGYLIQCMKINW